MLRSRSIAQREPALQAWSMRQPGAGEGGAVIPASDRAHLWSAKAGRLPSPCSSPRTLCPDLQITARDPLERSPARRPADSHRRSQAPPLHPACQHPADSGLQHGATRLPARCQTIEDDDGRTESPARANLSRSGPQVADPTVGRDPGVDGISNTVHPRSSFGARRGVGNQVPGAHVTPALEISEAPRSFQCFADSFS